VTRALLALLIVLAFPTLARAEVERYAVIIGHDRGQRDEVELSYAESDAAKVNDVLRDLGGFNAENIVLLRGEDATAARRALIAMNERIRTRASASPSMLFVYYSGHADARSLHLGRSQLDLPELEQLVRGSAATFRVLVVDACRSGVLTRVKGGSSAPPIRISLDERLRGEGTVFLTASSANEDAQESDEIKGGFFTHYLVSGLVGAADVDFDGAVTLEEAYQYTYEHTLSASSRTAAGTQHPTFDYDVKGAGPIVLTRVTPSQRRAVVQFPRDRTYYLFMASADGPLVAEVGEKDSMRRISVREGVYFVRGRARDYLLEGMVKLVGGSTRSIDDGVLERIAYARLVRKGVGILHLVQGLQAGARARTSLTDGSPCFGAFAGYLWEVRALSFAPRLGVCHEAFSNDTLKNQSILVDLELRLTHAWDFPWLTLEVGLAPGVGYLRQSFDSRGEVTPKNVTVGQLGVILAVSHDLRRGSYLGAEVTPGTYFLRRYQDGAWHADFGVRGALFFGLRF
jgi:Caspase domain